MRRSLLVTAGLAGFFLLTACGSEDEPEAEGGPTTIGSVEVEEEGEIETGGVLVIDRGAETADWNPATAQWGGTAYVVANALFDPLTAYDAEYQPHPYLAESVEPNQDFTEWTVTMRPGVTFHDGSAADGAALRTHFEAIQASPITGSTFARILSMEPVGDLGLKFTMVESWSTFPHALAVQPGFVAAPAQYTAANPGTTPIGTGPFVLDDLISDDTLTVDANENYWREGLPYLDRIEFPIVTDTRSRATRVINGESDIGTFTTQNAEQIARLNDEAQSGNIQFFTDNSGETTETFLQLNANEAPFDELVCRQAVAATINTQAMSDEVFSSLAPPAVGPFKPESPWYVDSGYPATYDLAEAQRLVDECVDLTGTDLTFDVLIPTGTDVLEIAQFAVQQGAAVGATPVLVQLEPTAHILQTLGSDYQASAFRIPFFTHPDQLSPFIGSETISPKGTFGLNSTQLPNDTIDEALAAARATDDVEIQRQQYAIVQEELTKDMTRIWLVHDIESIAATNQVRDITNWTFPDGETLGIGQIAAQFNVSQIWKSTE